MTSETKFNKIIIGILSFIVINFSACTQIDEPPLVYDPNAPANLDPIITSIDPKDFALAGYTQIKITGKNFAPTIDTITGNTVYFGSKKAEVISASKTDLIVIAPDIESDSVTIKVVSPGAYHYAKFEPYAVKRLVQKINTLEDPDDETHNPRRGQTINGFDLGPDGSIYVLSRLGVKGVIAKITVGGTLINSPEFPSSPSVRPSNIKYGPGGYIYWLRGTGDGKIIYKVSPIEGVPETWATLPENVEYFDFDKDKNVYALGEKGMFLVNSSGLSSTLVGDYVGFDPRGIKVTEAYVYVLGTSDNGVAGIWKSQILDGGNLGDKALVFNWSDAGEFSNSDFSSFALAENSDIYIATDNQANPILVVREEGSIITLYPGQLPTHSDLTTGDWQLTWSNGKYLYQYRTGTNLIYKIFIGKNGVPYFGRQ